LIAPIGDFKADILEALARMIPSAFDLPCRIASLIHAIDFSWNAERAQFHSTAILEKLTERIPDDVCKIIALTREDLFIPILTHVYGEAQLGGTSSIVSVHRLGQGISPTGQRKIYLERIAKEAAHELGHTFDLKHCRDSQCLMHYCRSIGDVDGKTDRFCRYCQVMLNDQLKRLQGTASALLPGT
jgi:archaemetzincin